MFWDREATIMKENSGSNSKNTQNYNKIMLHFLVHNMFMVFTGVVFKPIFGIAVAPLLSDKFLFSFNWDS